MRTTCCVLQTLTTTSTTTPAAHLASMETLGTARQCYYCKNIPQTKWRLYVLRSTREMICHAGVARLGRARALIELAYTARLKHTEVILGTGSLEGQRQYLRVSS